MRRALITGIAGFAGSHLAEELLGSGFEVCGLYLDHAPLRNLEHLKGALRLESCDILRGPGLGAAVERFAPDIVFHLAAVSFVPSAEEAPGIALEANVRGSMNVFEECRKRIPKTTIVFTSSAEVYGKAAPEEMPLAEDHPLRPVSIYALTKLCAEEFARHYSRTSALRIVILRPFNHIGPRQDPRFVTSSFARQIAEIEAGMRPPLIEVGNLEAARDFTDVRDMVRAYRMAAERCEPGVPYNVSSGRAYVIRDILDKLLAMSRVKVEIRRDPSRLRKSDVPIMRGDHSRFSAATGWKPERNIETTLADILDYWRERIAARGE